MSTEMVVNDKSGTMKKRSSRKSVINIPFRSLLIDGLVFSFLAAFFSRFFLEPLDVDNFNLASYAWWALSITVAGLGLSYILQGMWGIRTLGNTLFGRVDPESAAKPWFQTFWGLQTLLLFLGLFWISLDQTKFDINELFHREGLKGAGRIFTALLNPDWSVLTEGVFAMAQSIFIAFLATALAVPVAFVLSFFCARNIMSRMRGGMTLYGILRSLFNLTRSVEPILWAIIFSVWVGFGPFAGMLALLIHSVASLAKLYSEQVECVLEGPIEGIQSTGANGLQTIWFAVVPQVVMPHLGYTIYRWDINVRMATIIGFVGGGGIGSLLFQYQGQGIWTKVATLVVIITAVVWAMDTLSAYVREALK